MSISGARKPRLATEYGIASGGTETDITVSGIGYKLHTFSATGTLYVTQPGWFDYTFVGPGGAGGHNGRGGGAGGCISQGTLYLSANETITIGAGVAGNQTPPVNNTIRGATYTGIDSDIIAFCGAFGDSNGGVGILGGGSGGNYNAGGAGTVGANGTDISTWLGQSAGTTIRSGGGGGGSSSGAGAAGGSGGGGAGGGTSVAVNGTANTGGGGGGQNTNIPGASGGSGIAYIRRRVSGSAVGILNYQPILADVEYLVIGGGGGGGKDSGTGTGSGGGAGGYRSSVTGENSGGGASAENKLFFVAGTTHAVTVGAGGAGGTVTDGSAGTMSVFSSITSVGGGFGGGISRNGGGGGSGGGGISGGSGTTNQGYAGGSSSSATGTGGGGASSAGASSAGGAAGAGLSSSITGSSLTRAVGGAGNMAPPASKVANTGDGGDGGASGADGTAGATGVVIVRYPTANATGLSVTGGTITTSGSWTIHTFNSSGSFTVARA